MLWGVFLICGLLEIEPVEITMYSLSNGCQSCVEAKTKLEKHGVKVNVINDVYNEVPVFKIKDKVTRDLKEVYKILNLEEELIPVPVLVPPAPETKPKITYRLMRRGRRYYWVPFVEGGDSSRQVSRCPSY